MRRGFPLVTLVGLLSLGSLPAAAVPILQPTNLSVGQTYHLVFTTHFLQADPTSTAISFYDAIVQSVADAASVGTGSAIGDISWRVIGSTATVDAITHTNVQGPVYGLNETKIADDSSDLWDGSIGGLICTVNVLCVGVGPWTGTASDGTALAGFELGAAGPVGVGASLNFTSGDWVDFGTIDPAVQNRRYYAISELLTVIPEPTTALTFGLGIAGLAVLRRR